MISRVNRIVTTHATALKVIGDDKCWNPSFNCNSNTSNKYVVAGMGPTLQVYRVCTGALMAQVNVLWGERIHNIDVNEVILDADLVELIVLVLGKRRCKVIHLTIRPTGTVVKVVHDCGELSDVIWHGIFLGEKSLAIGLANGVVEVYRYTDGRCMYRASCGSRRMLYSLNLFQPTEHHLVVASGTVFGELLVWDAKNGNLFGKVQAHQGNKVLCWNLVVSL